MAGVDPLTLAPEPNLPNLTIAQALPNPDLDQACLASPT